MAGSRKGLVDKPEDFRGGFVRAETAVGHEDLETVVRRGIVTRRHDEAQVRPERQAAHAPCHAGRGCLADSSRDRHAFVRQERPRERFSSHSEWKRVSRPTRM